jgi:hypothetical protein
MRACARGVNLNLSPLEPLHHNLLGRQPAGKASAKGSSGSTAPGVPAPPPVWNAASRCGLCNRGVQLNWV